MCALEWIYVWQNHSIGRNSRVPEHFFAFIYPIDISENRNLMSLKHGTKTSGGVMNRDHKHILKKPHVSMKKILFERKFVLFAMSC